MAINSSHSLLSIYPEECARTIVSGIRNHVTLDDFVGTKVLVFCNLKEKPLLGISSHGMITCASIDDESAPEGKKVRLLNLPPSAQVGDRVLWDGESVDVDSPYISNNRMRKVMPQLKTNDEGALVWKEWSATVNGEKIRSEIHNATVG